MPGDRCPDLVSGFFRKLVVENSGTEKCVFAHILPLLHKFKFDKIHHRGFKILEKVFRYALILLRNSDFYSPFRSP